MSSNHLVIMAGGVGSRFWPMSTPECPKQFIDVMGVGRSMIQLTADRFDGIVPKENMWVVTSQKYAAIVAEQLPFMDADHILLEPCMRNTAPCIAYVSWKIASRYPDANVVFSPADHLIVDVQKFREVVAKGLEFTSTDSRILTLGMRPTRPETGYGYIKAIPGEGEILKVEAFKEKPDLETAKRYLAEGGYSWNSGLFLWNVRTILDSFRSLKPGIAAIFDEVAPSLFTPDEQTVINRRFPDCEAISIDYAIMEHSDSVYTFPSDFGWSDIGTWGSLQTLLEQDGEGNAVVGSAVKMVDSKGCMVHVPGLKQVVIQGLEDCIVAEHDGTLLICRLDSEQNIKQWH